MTNRDLRALEERLMARIEEVRRHTTILIEDVRSDIRMLAETLAGGFGRRGTGEA